MARKQLALTRIADAMVRDLGGGAEHVGQRGAGVDDVMNPRAVGDEGVSDERAVAGVGLRLGTHDGRRGVGGGPHEGGEVAAELVGCM
jgi:hypothetical protein